MTSPALPPVDVVVKSEPVDAGTLARRQRAIAARLRRIARLDSKWDALSIELCLLTSTATSTLDGGACAKVLAAAELRLRPAHQLADERRRLRLAACGESDGSAAALRQQQQCTSAALTNRDASEDDLDAVCAAKRPQAASTATTAVGTAAAASVARRCEPQVPPVSTVRQMSGGAVCEAAATVASSVTSAVVAASSSTAAAVAAVSAVVNSMAGGYSTPLSTLATSQQHQQQDERRSSVDQWTPRGVTVKSERLSPPPQQQQSPTQTEAGVTSVGERGGCHEAAMRRRVQQLRRQGLWSERRLPRVAEPRRRRRTHWDCVLAEMQWMAADFAQERRWKVEAARHCAAAVADHVQATRRRETARAAGVAAVVARHVRRFWTDARRTAAVRRSCRLQRGWRRVYRHIERAERSAAGQQALWALRRLHAEAHMPLGRLIDSLPPNYVRSVGAQCEPTTIGNVAAAAAAAEGDSSSDAGDDSLAAATAAVSVLDAGQASDASTDQPAPDVTESLSFDKCDSDCESDSGCENSQPVDMNLVDVSAYALAVDEQDPERETSIASTSPRVASCCSSITERLQAAAASIRSVSPLTCDTSATDADAPTLLRRSLRPFQQVGWRWVYAARRQRLNVLLADESGLGKSTQVAAVLAHVAAADADWGRHLVVTAARDVLDWCGELRRCCPALKVHVYDTLDSDDDNDCDACDSEVDRESATCTLSTCHVCVVSYRRLYADRVVFLSRRWRTLVLDHVHRLVADAGAPYWRFLRRLRGRQRVLLSDASLYSTIQSAAAVASAAAEDGDGVVINRLADLRCLWRLACLLLPATGDRGTACLTDDRHRTSSVRRRLGAFLAAFTLCRRVDQLTAQQPVVSDNVILCPLVERQRRLYERLMSSALVRRAATHGKFADVVCAVRQLRNVCNHPCLVSDSAGTATGRSTPFTCRPIELCVPACVARAIAAGGVAGLSSRWTPCALDDQVAAYAASRQHSLLPTRLQIAYQMLLQSTCRPSSPPCPVAAVPLNLDVDNVASRDPSGGGGASEEQTLLSLMLTDGESAGGGVTALSRLVALVEGQWRAAGVPAAATTTRQQSPPPTPPPSPRPTLSTATVAAAAVVVLSSRPAGHSPPPPPTHSQSTASAFLSCDWAGAVYEINRQRCELRPMYGRDAINALTVDCRRLAKMRPYTHALLDAFDCVVSGELLMYTPAAVSCGQCGPQISIQRATASAPTPWHSDRQAIRRALTADPTLACGRRARQLHWLATGRIGLWRPASCQLPADSGKLRLLEQLLRQLQRVRRRVLLLAQTTAAIDLLHRFLTAVRYAHVRLDATVSPQRRHALMRRFSADRRLSVVLMATGTPMAERCRELLACVDTVIVYDADWLCGGGGACCAGAVGLAGDVHIYRLVSERTVEENAVKSVDETRLTRELLVHAGDEHCVSAWRCRSPFLRDLFGDAAVAAAAETDHHQNVGGGQVTTVSAASIDHALAMVVDDDSDAAAALAARASQQAHCAEFECPPSVLSDSDDQDDEVDHISGGDEYDCDAIEATLESDGDEDGAVCCRLPTVCRLHGLSGVRRWAVERVSCGDDRVCCAEATKHRTSSGRALTRSPPCDAEPVGVDTAGQHFHQLTYPTGDVSRIWISNESQRTRLPVWSPPTPPRDDELDVYVDPACNMLYSMSYMSEHQLPPVYVKKEPPRRKQQSAAAVAAAAAAAAAAANSHQLSASSAQATSAARSLSCVSGGGGGGVMSSAPATATSAAARSKPLKVRREEGSAAPRSLFNRVPSSMLRFRRELNLQQRRTLFSTGGSGSSGNAFGLTLGKLATTAGGHMQSKASLLEQSTADWLVHEDWTLLQAVRCVLEMPLNLLAVSPAHVVNWEMVGELVNRTARAYRSPKFCRMRYDSAILPREEGKVAFSSSSKKSKKHKQQQHQQMSIGGAIGSQSSLLQQQQLTKASRPVRTSQMVAHDKNEAFSQLLCQRFENMSAIATKRAPPTRPSALPALASAAVAAAATRVARHAAVLADSGVEYEQPLTPAQIAVQRAARLTRDKQRLVSGEQLSRLHKTPTQSAATATAVAGARVQTTPCAARVAGNTIVSVSSVAPIQVAQQRLVSASLAAATAGGGVSVASNVIAGKQQPAIQALTQKSLTPSQLQALKQQTVLRHKLALAAAAAAAGGGGGGAISSAGQKLQVEVSSLSTTPTGVLSVGSSGVVTSSAAAVVSGGIVQLTQTPARTQVRILKQPAGRHMVAARTMTESEMAVILKQRPQLATAGAITTTAGAVQASLVPQLLAHVQSAAASSSVTISLPRPATPGTAGRPILTQSVRKLATTCGASVAVAGGKRLPAAQLSTVQLVQSGGGGGQKSLPAGTVTVQQLQPVVGRLQTSATSSGGGVNTGGGSRLNAVAGHGSPRQTIQVVTAPASGIRQPATVQLLPSTAAAGGVTLAQLRPVLCATSSSTAVAVAPVVVTSSAAGAATSGSSGAPVTRAVYHQACAPFVVTTAPAALLNRGLQVSVASTLPSTVPRVRTVTTAGATAAVTASPSTAATPVFSGAQQQTPTSSPADTPSGA